MLVGGRYETIRELSKGRVGKTYLADDTYRRSSTKYVVKCFKPLVNAPVVLQVARDFFDTEVKMLSLLGKHDQIPRQFAYFEQNGEFFVVQEFIDGHTMQLPLGIKLDDNDAIALLGEILEILAFVHHKNYIHLDVKPQNLIRRRQDRKLVLIDFAELKVIRNLKLDGQGQVIRAQEVGTLGYTPKEQWEGNPEPCSDIYALGMLGIQAVTGLLPNQLPRDPSTQEVIWHDQAQVGSFLRGILDTMVRYRPEERFQAAAEVLEALGLPVPEFLPDDPPPAPVQAVEVKKPGYVVIQPQFELAMSFYEQLAPAIVKDRLGYIDRTGKFAIPPQFGVNPRGLLRQSGYQFSEGLACVEVDGKWGYVDETGNLRIPAEYDSAERFAEGLARIELDHHYGYINQAGERVIQPQFESAARTFSEELAGVEIDHQYGYIDHSGAVVIPPSFESAERFTEGLARVTMQHKYGFINKTGQFVIYPQFDVAHRFAEGLARVRIDEKYGYLDRQGNVVIAPQFDDNYNFADGLALVRNGQKYGYIDKTGKVVIHLAYDDAYPFSQGLAAVKVNNVWGFIDKTGLFVINLQFAEVRSFINGLAAVKIEDRWGYIGQ